ncbi:MAG: hypothetical protein KF691_09745 [Phycisphaeraceae bacterium]|nr:hypothetical protein [Phycisphaeraceae bacterium]
MSPPIKALQPDLDQFAPDHDGQQLFFDLLLDPSQSLLSIAAHFQTSAGAISLFLSRPEIADQFASLENLVARRTRLAAGAQLSAVIASAQRVLDSFESGDSSCSRETALRASRILIRLANFASGPVMPRESVAKSSRSGARRAEVFERSAPPRHRDTDEAIHAPRESEPLEVPPAQFEAEKPGDPPSDEPPIGFRDESHCDSPADLLAGISGDSTGFVSEEAEQVRLALEALKSEYSDAELHELFRVAAEIVAEAEQRGINVNSGSDPPDLAAGEGSRAIPLEPVPRAFSPP